MGSVSGSQPRPPGLSCPSPHQGLSLSSPGRFWGKTPPDLLQGTKPSSGKSLLSQQTQAKCCVWISRALPFAQLTPDLDIWGIDAGNAKSLQGEIPAAKGAGLEDSWRAAPDVPPVPRCAPRCGPSPQGCSHTSRGSLNWCHWGCPARSWLTAALVPPAEQEFPWNFSSRTCFSSVAHNRRTQTHKKPTKPHQANTSIRIYTDFTAPGGMHTEIDQTDRQTRARNCTIAKKNQINGLSPSNGAVKAFSASLALIPALRRCSSPTDPQDLCWEGVGNKPQLTRSIC